MNEELKLILYSFRQKMRFGNGNADNLCEYITTKQLLNNERNIVHSCLNVSCTNCNLYNDYNNVDRIIHVWNQL